MSSRSLRPARAPDRAALVLAALLAFVLAAPAAPAAPAVDRDFADLASGETIGGFRVESIYLSDAGAAMGARFRHVPSGFILDCLRIQSVPQAFMWVNSAPSSDRGEPHTGEHLLLGKGNRGRYVASLEEMSLGTSSAFTMRLRTCYHFHTAAGAETFYELLAAKLEAMVHPDFTDEEIRREVCHMGLTVDPATGAIRLEEKGTVYNEMVSSFERPWGPLAREMDQLLYGPRHPMALSSGGFPDSIRTMVPGHMREFLAATHHISNMGMVMSIPDAIALAGCLERVGAILARIEPAPRPGPDPATAAERLPAPRPAPPGAIAIVEFPHQNANEPGLLLFGWAPLLDLDVTDSILLDLLVKNLAGGETADLYRMFVDSETRVMDVGASEVFGWTTENPGHPFYIGLQNVRPDVMTEDRIAAVRTLLLAELERVAALPDGSPDLRAYNERAENRLIERERELRKFLNSPPGFGARNMGAAWMEHLTRLQGVAGPRKSLALKEQFAAVAALLHANRNVWRDAIRRFELLSRPPAAVAARPNPDLLARSEAARAARREDYTTGLEAGYQVASRDQALARFKADYDVATAEIERAARAVAMPAFIADPPLTLDDQLRYRVTDFPGGRGGQLVTSLFDHLSGATVGLAFRLDPVPESLLVYVPALPSLLTDAGVIRDGQPLPYAAMKEAVRREVLELAAYFSVNPRSGRTELAVRGAGTDARESATALDWIETVLFAADWRSENLPRVRDCVDGALAAARDRMHAWEEMWVDEVGSAYWKQDDPTLLLADCFLSQEHALLRLRWQLMDPGTPAELAAASDFLRSLADYGDRADRAGLLAVAGILADPASPPPALAPEARALVADAAALPGAAGLAARAAGKDLRQSLAALPEETLAADWRYLCTEMTADLAVSPAEALARVGAVRDLLLRADNVRGFLVANPALALDLESRLGRLAARLGAEPSVRQAYPAVPRIVARASDRHPELAPAGGGGEPVRPVYAGLMNESTRAGVVMNGAKAPSYLDTDRESLLRFLAARLYGGGGAHSLFMKTWGAGLAYSNGIGSNPARGRLSYYAERCSDLAETMRFVVRELETARPDSTLGEYALAQAFGANRGAERYEERGEAMAADLTDGMPPEVVKTFRTKLLALRSTPGLHAELSSRMESVYGQVLPGYGETADSTAAAAGAEEAQSVVIGPEKQFQSYERYLQEALGKAVPVYRLYPRDFWITLAPGSAPPRPKI